MHPEDPINRIMTEAVLSVDAGAPAGEVLRLFAAYPIHHLPVVDHDEVVGMLGSTDLMKLELLMPKVAGASPVAYLNETMSVRQLIRRPPLTIGERQTVDEAARVMAKHAVHALPVVNARRHLVGIVTTTDIMQAALGAPARSGGPRDQAAGGAVPAPERLSAEALAAARAAAERAWTGGVDRDGVAAALLYLYRRTTLLEQLRQIAERYVTAGQDEHLHSLLLKAVAAVREDDKGSGADAAFGLGG